MLTDHKTNHHRAKKLLKFRRLKLYQGDSQSHQIVYKVGQMKLLNVQYVAVGFVQKVRRWLHTRLHMSWQGSTAADDRDEPSIAAESIQSRLSMSYRIY